MDNLAQDVRHALRKLRMSPGFSTVAILTLALGIGANSAIFSVVNGVLLRPLPYHEPEQLVTVSSVTERSSSGSLSALDYADLRDQNRVFSEMAAVNNGYYSLTGDGEPERVSGTTVTANLFSVLGVPAQIGRTLVRGEDQPGQERSVVISASLWQRRYAADPDIVGQTIRIDGDPYTVVGVMPPGFRYPTDAELWVPFVWEGDLVAPDNRGAHFLNGIARLKPGVTAAQASADVKEIAKRLEEQYPNTNTGFSAGATYLREALVGDVRPALFILLGAVAMVLLIACANLSNLLLARAASREGEISLRLAMGAGRDRIVRQLLVESGVLAIAGGALGLLLASWGLDLLKAMGPQDLPRLQDVSLDVWVIGFTALLSIGTAFLFGLVPALQISRTDLNRSLRDVGRGGRAGARNGARNLLIISETALAVMLLVAAGLLLKSFVRLQSVDPGFSAENVLAIDVALPGDAYEGGTPAVGAFYDRLLEQLRALPGVTSAGATFLMPLTGSTMMSSLVDVARPEPEPGKTPLAHIRVATPGYLETIGIPLKRGRSFTQQDRGSAARVVMISEEAARRYWPGEDPIGRTVAIGVDFGMGEMGGEVVGIVGNVRHTGLAEDLFPEAYVPFEQAQIGDVTLLVRTTGDPAALANLVRSTVRGMDPDVPLANMRTVESILQESVAEPRFFMLLVSSFAALAVILAALGIYGVVANAVTHRTQEFGIRMALGASGRDVIRLVLRNYLPLTAVGLAAGLIAAIAGTRVLASLLFGVGATDLMTFASVVVLLAAVSLTASLVPARRATRVDPILALKHE